MAAVRVMRGSSDLRRGAGLWAVKNVVFVAVSALILLAVSGDPRWLAAWSYLGFLVLYLLTLAVTLYRLHPEMLAERSGVQPGSESWDVPLASLSAVWLPLTLYLVSALDQRFVAATTLRPAWVFLGVGLVVVGSTLVLAAMAANAYFSSVVRLQADRGHRVVDSGPYRFVCHPGYLGACLIYPGVALWLGSVWALLPAAAIVIVTGVRTAKEDDFLTANLDGYADYSRHVRWRLVPVVW